MDLERLYAYRFKDVDQQAREAVWAPIARFLYEALDRPARVLDTVALAISPRPAAEAS